MKPTIVNTADGSKTIYLKELDEQYHSLNGAFTESGHVYIQSGFNFCKEQNPGVLEIGFGTGLNCLLTAMEAEKQKRNTIYFTIEKYPVAEKIIRQLNYGSLISPDAEKVFQKIHTCSWGKTEQVSRYFQLCKLQADITADALNKVQECNVAYFDAFGPDKQPEMWTMAVFGKVFEKLKPNGIFVTYSAKGVVRRQLTATGLIMERLPGPPGKKEMLRGIKPLSKL